MEAYNTVLFVCLGNICRSPMAEAVFNDVALEYGVSKSWRSASVGILDNHIGQPPDPRTLAVLKKHGLGTYKHIGRQFTIDDFYKYDFILCMDESNLFEIRRRQPKGSKAKVLKLGSFDPEGGSDIADPYYLPRGIAFEEVYQKCLRSCQGFLKKYSQKDF